MEINESCILLQNHLLYPVNADKHTDKDDSELLAIFYASGNNELLGVLLQRYTLLLFGTCMKYLKNEQKAKEAVQHIYLQALDGLQKNKVIYFKSWLYMIAKNHCLMQFRNKAPGYYKELDESNTPTEDYSVLHAIHKDRLLEMTELALPELNEEQKKCITLFYLEKKTYNEVCTETGFNLMQVKSFIQNGKKRLKNIIEKKMKEKYG